MSPAISFACVRSFNRGHVFLNEVKIKIKSVRQKKTQRTHLFGVEVVDAFDGGFFSLVTGNVKQEKVLESMKVASR